MPYVVVVQFDAWRADAERWAQDRLGPLGLTQSGPMVVVSRQAWSTVWRLPTGETDVMIKQTTPARRMEGLVQRFCATVAPDLVDQPLAVDPAAGRFLMHDTGPTLHASDPDHGGVSLATVTAMIKDYATLQRATIGQDQQATAAGLPRWDPAAALLEVSDQAALLHDLPSSDPRHLTVGRVQVLRSASAAIERTAQRLAADPLPSCLDHGDLWAGNAISPGHPSAAQAARERYQFIDFGDAAWSHPFLSLIMVIVDCRHRWAVPDLPHVMNLDHPILRQLIDAYLQCWTDFAPLPDLRRIMADALRLAPLRRSRAWITNLADADVDTVTKQGRLPWLWLHDLTLPVVGLDR